MPRVYERVYRTTFELGPPLYQPRPGYVDTMTYTVRVWCAVPDLKLSNAEHERQIRQAVLLNFHPPHVQLVSPEAIAESIAALPFCNAVEILDEWGQGLLIYPEWP